MIFHENRLLANDSHEIFYIFFFSKLEKMSQNLSSAAVVIGALRVNLARVSTLPCYDGNFCCLLITFPNSLDPDKDRRKEGPDLYLNRLTL